MKPGRELLFDFFCSEADYGGSHSYTLRSKLSTAVAFNKVKRGIGAGKSPPD